MSKVQLYNNFHSRNFYCGEVSGGQSHKNVLRVNFLTFSVSCAIL